MRTFITLLTCLVFSFSGISQKAMELSPPEYIKTVHFLQSNEILNGVPLIKLGESFTVVFDDIIGDEAFYYYKISHYDFDWTPSRLAKNNYMEGIDDVRIQTDLNSLNTLQIFTNYKVTFPNQNTQALRATGNYLFELYNDNEELVFTKKFIIYTNEATVQAQIKRSRDLNFLHQKQVVQFSIKSKELIIAPERNLKTMVIQNSNLNNTITNLKPQFNIGETFTYKYDKEASFWGSNEYWNLDSKDIRNANSTVNNIELKDIYNHYLFIHPYRALRPYTYNPDVNGNFVIRNIDANDNSIESDYVWTHFELNVREIRNKEVHLYGNFNNYMTDYNTLMTYDRKTATYKIKYLLKQGFYNFKYVTKSKDGTIDEGEISGNFDETENEYLILVYYRGPSDQADRIIGVGSANSKDITN